VHPHRRARRRFLAAASAGALGPGASAIARALALPAEGRSGSLRDVQHIVVLTQENRSFDHYFGSLNGVRGFADPFPVPLPGGHTVWSQPRAPAKDQAPAEVDGQRVAPYRLDTQAHFAWMRAAGTPHRWPDAQQAWDHGRMADWPSAKGNHTMAHFGASDLPFHTALANAFTLCDAYHCSMQGGTHPNRYFLNTGTNDPFGQGGGPALYNDFDDFGPAQGPGSDAGYHWTTYAERLQAAGVSWHVYQDLDDNFDDNSLAAFRRFRDAVHRRSAGDEALSAHAASSGGLARLQRDVLDGRLPSVSWIVGPAEGSEHPWKSSPAQGADYTAKVLAALTANPEVWGRTVLLINYDENDGFFDHMPPPAPPSTRRVQPRFELAGASTVDTRGEYHLHLPAGHDGADEAAWLGRPYGLGPRVPMFVVSPWSRGGWVCSQVFDHTSVIRLMEARFGVHEPNISPWRRAVCGDLTATLDFSRADRRPPGLGLPVTSALAQRARSLPDTPTPPAPATAQAPVQAAGARPARALPYALHAHCSVERPGELRLRLHNQGRAAAVVQVYDRLRLAELPRRYTVGPGQTLNDTWATQADGLHDLWLLGPNGWHRQFQGRARMGEPTATLLPRPDGSALSLSLRNPSAQAINWRLQAAAYQAKAPRSIELAAGAQLRIELPLDPRHHWYDWVLSRTDAPDEAPACLKRWAGHVETGRPSVSDPAMHGEALLRSWAGDQPPARPVVSLNRG